MNPSLHSLRMNLQCGVYQSHSIVGSNSSDYSGTSNPFFEICLKVSTDLDIT